MDPGVSLDSVRDVIDYNKTIHSEDTGLGINNGRGDRSDRIPKKDCKKVILYNIRYNRTKKVRSDIDILDEYNYLKEAQETLEEYLKQLHIQLNDLDNPSTIERVKRTFITWAWSDNPRKNRNDKRSSIQKQIREVNELLVDITFQLPLYCTVASATTTLDIKLKKSKLKNKYAKKSK